MVMYRPGQYEEVKQLRFALVGNPVAHSLSPVMHNVVYRDMAARDKHFALWSYEAHLCENEADAIENMNLVRSGYYRGMNVTMPYKPLALEQADFVDSVADAAGGANVLVRKGFDLYAYNTDGLGALGAVERASGQSAADKRVAVCGTGPTSMAIACAFANAKAAEVVVVSRERSKANVAIERLRSSLKRGATFWIRAADYETAPLFVPAMDIIVDATPRGMKPGDEAVIDTKFLHAGQIVLDTVYAHGTTRLVAGAREAGALAMDGLEMLVEQAALSIEIWAEAMGLAADVSREVMRTAAMCADERLQ